GRRSEFASFPEFSNPARRNQIPDPCESSTFSDSKLQWNQRTVEIHQDWLDHYKRLLALRKKEIIPKLKAGGKVTASFETFGEKALHCTWNFADQSHLYLLANLGDAKSEFPASKHSASRVVFQVSKSKTFDAQGKDWLENPLPPWTVIW